jgi:hypothetical protein
MRATEKEPAKYNSPAQATPTAADYLNEEVENDSRKQALIVRIRYTARTVDTFF